MLADKKKCSMVSQKEVVCLKCYIKIHPEVCLQLRQGKYSTGHFSNKAIQSVLHVENLGQKHKKEYIAMVERSKVKKS